MIALQPVFFTMGLFLTTLAGMMVLPAIADWGYGDENWIAFALSVLITGFMGLVLSFAARPAGSVTLTVREAFIMTVSTWVVVSVFAALPFVLCNSTRTFTDSFFETISGLTTTGATVMSGLDFASPGILLWRALLQWFGGIGIIVMAITVMPLLKIGGMQLFRSEFSDRSEKIMPRVSQIAGVIVFTYCFLTALCVGLLYAAGMSFLEAVCHGMSTVSTGGFSTSDASIAYFNNPIIETIIAFFMVLGSLTFVIFVKMLQGAPGVLWEDQQIRGFLKVLMTVVAGVVAWRVLHDVPPLTACRESFFTVASILTTTGFVTSDFTLWGTFVMMLMLILMTIGGCTGSTSGGIKVLRFQIMLEVAKSHLRQLRHPHGVFPPVYNDKPIPEGVALSVFAFFALYFASLGCVVMGLGMCGLDMTTTISTAISCLNNIGPAYGSVVGTAGQYAALPDGAKWVLMAGMLLGRLEYITVIILLLPRFWRD